MSYYGGYRRVREKCLRGGGEEVVGEEKKSHREAIIGLRFSGNAEGSCSKSSMTNEKTCWKRDRRDAPGKSLFKPG